LEKFPSVVSDIMKKLVTIDGSGSVKEAAEIML
jgi:CBS domain-containing protein